MKNLLILFFIFLFLFSKGQINLNTFSDLKEVIINSYNDKSYFPVTTNFELINTDSNFIYQSLSLSERLTETPGISMLNNGPGISKPVIRGLFGNRICILMSGMKSDNQQWQEEHGIGIASLGIAKVNIIKGALGALHGSGSMGGIIQLIDEADMKNTYNYSDASLTIHSNTMGVLFQSVIVRVKNNNQWGIRLGMENNADYSEGNNKRILNSRFNGYFLKTFYGFQRKKWNSVNKFHSSLNRYGFLMSNNYDELIYDNRWSRQLSINPFHVIMLNHLTTQNEYKINTKSLLKLNAGIQSNKRMENEGGSAISLDMHLLTLQHNIKYEYAFKKNMSLNLSAFGVFENNTNFGSRKLIPDANMNEMNVSAILLSSINKNFFWENGIGIGEKKIRTFLTESINESGMEIQPLFKKFLFYNLYTGLVYNPTLFFSIKGNISTGVRAPNLAELSSNGLHEGTFSYEIGDMDLKNEKAISMNISFNVVKNKFEFIVSPFKNIFSNFISLYPTAEKWFGFPIYRFKQKNAKQNGIEISGGYNVKTRLNLKVCYSFISGKSADGNYLPLTPPQKLVPSIKFAFNKNRIPFIDLFSNLTYVFIQNKTAPNELPTSSYQLWNAGFSRNFKIKNQSFCFSLSCNNILNKAYFDQLSLLKRIGVMNMGRNFELNTKIKF